MINAFLENVEIRNIKFLNDMNLEKSMELDIEMEHSVSISEDGKRCIGELGINIYPQKKNAQDDDNTMKLSINMHGYFSTNGVFKDTKELNKVIYQKLFPHLQAYIKTITAIAGVPPLFVPEAPANEFKLSKND